MAKVIREIGIGFYGPVSLIKDSKSDSLSVQTKIHKWKLRKRDHNWILNLPSVIDHHDNIAKMEQKTEQTDDAFIWRHEFVRFGNLLDHIPPDVGIDENRAKNCLRQIKSGLEYLHNKSLVHGNIKAENIYVCDPEVRKVKITGFTYTRLSGALTIKNVNNAPYLAPEIFQKLDNENFPAHYSQDSWSFGILLYSVISGSFPWLHAETSTSKDYRKYYDWHKHRTIVVPVSWQKFHPKLHKLLKKLLHPKATKRSSVTYLNKFLAVSWMKHDEDSGYADDIPLSQCNAEEIEENNGAMKELSSKLQAFGVATQGTREWRRSRTESWVESTGEGQ